MDWDNFDKLKNILSGIKLSTSNINTLEDSIKLSSNKFILPAKAKQFFKSLQVGAISTTSIEANISYSYLENIYSLHSDNSYSC